jgi:hypothetical protein
MGKRSSARRVTAFMFAASLAVMLAACTPEGPDGNADVPVPLSSGLPEVTGQTILGVAPTGVTPTGSFDEPADGFFVPFNAASRTFSAPTEAAAAAAAAQLRTAALADGWTGTGFEDPGGTGGVPTAVLTKGSLVLEISYTTDVYKQNWSSDDDGFEVRMVVTDEPTTTEIPADGAS